MNGQQRSSESGDVTRLLRAFGDGDRGVEQELMQVVYDDLHRMAHRQVQRESDNVFQTTSLVHEAYLRLVDQNAVRWQNRAHFFAIAARVMRRVLVDHARARNAARRGGRAQLVNLTEAEAVAEQRSAEVVALDEALAALTAVDERKSRVVELRFFGGLSITETAEVLGVSEGTVERDWTIARAWLRRALDQGCG